MPKFFFTTDDGKRVDEDNEGMDLPDEIAARDEAQNALVDIARERLPNGRSAAFKVEVRDETGDDVYLASLRFEGVSPKEKAAEDANAAEAAAAEIAAALKRLR